MNNIKLTIEYDGTNYCGWQKQKTRRKQNPSIQRILESCLKKILKHKVNLIASGRTDSGVHAIGQVANFKTTSKIATKIMMSALNGNLPQDIRILRVEGVPLEFHSRYSVRSKIYRYYLLNQSFKSPFFDSYSYWFKFSLDINLMKKAASYLTGRYDFKALCASGSSVEDTIRTIKKISISKLKIFNCNMICIEIESDGFLYNMVRNIIGTLIEVGRGRFSPKHIKKIIKSRNRSLAGPCVPAKGLFLVKVKY